MEARPSKEISISMPLMQWGTASTTSGSPFSGTTGLNSERVNWWSGYRWETEQVWLIRSEKKGKAVNRAENICIELKQRWFVMIFVVNIDFVTPCDPLELILISFNFVNNQIMLLSTHNYSFGFVSGLLLLLGDLKQLNVWKYEHKITCDTKTLRH